MGNGIGWAVKQMWDDKKVCRPGWNGEGMWLAIVRPEDWDAAEVQGNTTQKAFVALKTADNGFVPWTCSQADLLADDWQLTEDTWG